MNAIYTLESERDALRKAGSEASKMLAHLTSLVKPGITTNFLNEAAEEWVRTRGYTNGPLNYHGFPKSICTSVNEVISHGVPSDRILREGDIINIDVSPIVDGWFGDTSNTIAVGQINQDAADLLAVSSDLLDYVIKQLRERIKSGVPTMTSFIGSVIDEYLHGGKFCVVKICCGHGIGREFHANPTIYHFKNDLDDVPIVDGMVFTIEPAICTSPFFSYREHEIVSSLGLYSAQKEHMIMVNGQDIEVLT